MVAVVRFVNRKTVEMGRPAQLFGNGIREMLWILLVGIDALEGFVDGGPWGIAGIRWKWNRLSGTFVEDPSDSCGGKGEEGKEEEEAFHFGFPFFADLADFA